MKQLQVTQLEGLDYVCRWTTHMGCLKSCLDYLGEDISDAWLYGGTGHAFVINMHPELCPSGPTAWMYVMLFELAGNLGCKIEGVFAEQSEPEFAAKQKRAFDHIRQAIDKGLPCYGWELDIPEFYVINGYDDTGCYYKGVNMDAFAGPKPWQEMGQSDIGMLELYSVDRVTPLDDAQVVKAAFQAALKHASGTNQWIFDDYRSGLAGFDTWIAAMATGKADLGGLSYNAAVWSECRRYAVDFLVEAQHRLNGTTHALFDEAIGHYRVVRDNLAVVARLYPFSIGSYGMAVPVDDVSREAVAALSAAREAERCGLLTLEKIAAAL